ncbi:hypothetical protein WJX74_003488 [Apatococcus lobatus]|uniref:Uncharacterized protein n=1 Tax=Apatococcus lobatus TaxID=904363 RepID=A0AAW1RUA6_9CHLO
MRQARHGSQSIDLKDKTRQHKSVCAAHAAGAFIQLRLAAASESDATPVLQTVHGSAVYTDDSSNGAPDAASAAADTPTESCQSRDSPLQPDHVLPRPHGLRTESEDLCSMQAQQSHSTSLCHALSASDNSLRCKYQL